MSEILILLERVGAIINNSHIVYTSGRHGRSYVNKDALYPHTTETSFVCSCIAHEFADAGVEVVAGPTVGGVIMAQWVAHHLSSITGAPVLAIYAEEESGSERKRIFRRGYDDIINGKKVLVVEDILTTGGSARKVVDAVYAHGGTPIGLGALCNRGNLNAESFNVPHFMALVEISLESWEASECPLCRDGVPVNTKVGKGATFSRKPPLG